MQQKAELENRNLRNELELLKAQVNPHFLFNTLNNIDSLIEKSPGDASKALISLSDMLRYMIYDTQTDMVTLNNELNYIRHYIELQQLRFRQPDYISCSLPAQCNQRVAPLLLVPFIENAFKYAYNNGVKPVIDVQLHCTGDQLHFHISNHYNPQQQIIQGKGGVGIENIKRRLALIYPNKHELKITPENNIFTVDLIIELK